MHCSHAGRALHSGHARRQYPRAPARSRQLPPRPPPSQKGNPHLESYAFKIVVSRFRLNAQIRAQDAARHRLSASYCTVRCIRMPCRSSGTHAVRAAMRSRTRTHPRLHAHVAIRHHAVERSQTGIDIRGWKMMVAFMSVTRRADQIDRFARIFGIRPLGCAIESRDDENETKPVLAVLAETVIDRAAQDSSTHVVQAFSPTSRRMPTSSPRGVQLCRRCRCSGRDAGRPRAAMDHQHAPAFRRQETGGGGADRCAGHRRRRPGGGGTSRTSSWRPLQWMAWTYTVHSDPSVT